MKNVSDEELAEAIRQAHGGRLTLAPEAVQALIQSPSEVERLAAGLTCREHEVLALLVKGMSNPETAGQLFISRATVKVHITSIPSKLGFTSRVEAIALAIQNKPVRYSPGVDK